MIQEQIRGPFAALSWLRPLSWMENVKMVQDPGIREQECLLRNCFHSVPSPFSEGLGPGHAESHISPQLYLSGCTSSLPLGWWSRLNDREKWDLSGPPVSWWYQSFCRALVLGNKSALRVFRLRV